MNDGDLISRKALKKAAEELVAGGAERLKYYYENGSKSEENKWIGGVYDVWELIINAPTVEQECYITGAQWDEFMKEHKRPQGEWIPVSERLPEKSGNYMCTVDYGEDGIEVMQRVYWDALGGFEKRYNKNDRIIAWMPLPEAYKEAENENG